MTGASESTDHNLPISLNRHLFCATWPATNAHQDLAISVETGVEVTVAVIPGYCDSEAQRTIDTDACSDYFAITLDDEGLGPIPVCKTRQYAAIVAKAGIQAAVRIEANQSEGTISVINVSLACDNDFAIRLDCHRVAAIIAAGTNRNRTIATERRIEGSVDVETDCEGVLQSS